MSDHVYYIPGQTKGRSTAFLEWTSIDFSCKLPLTCGSNVNYFKSVHSYPFRRYSACGNKEHPGNFQNKLVTLLSIGCPGIYSSWPKCRVKGRGGHIMRLSLRALGYQKRWKVFPFVKFEIILPLPPPPPPPHCFFIRSPTNEHCRTLSSMMNLWIDSKTCQEKPPVSNAKV